MVIIEPHNESYLKSTTFKTAHEKFINKYKGKFTLSINTLDKSEINVNLNVFENTDKLGSLVRDFGNFTFFTITFEDLEGKKVSTNNNEPFYAHNYRAIFYMQQFPGLCGICIIHNISKKILDKNKLHFICDFFYHMGYTVIMLSIRVDSGSEGKLKENGFEPFMSLQNRRTSNDVTLFYKRLNTEE